MVMKLKLLIVQAGKHWTKKHSYIVLLSPQPFLSDNALIVEVIVNEVKKIENGILHDRNKKDSCTCHWLKIFYKKYKTMKCHM